MRSDRSDDVRGAGRPQESRQIIDAALAHNWPIDLRAMPMAISYRAADLLRSIDKEIAESLSIVIGSRARRHCNASCKLVRSDRCRYGVRPSRTKVTKMQSKKKSKKKVRDYSLSRHALSTEVQQAYDLLQLSCNWAFSLSEGVANFENSLSSAVSHLEELVEVTDQKDMSPEQQKKIRSVLWRLRKYSRQMYDGSEPLSVIGIIADVQMMDDLTGIVERVLAHARDEFIPG